MENRLNELRHQYKTARGILGCFNKLKVPPSKKSKIMTRMNKLRLQLKNEITRVSWLLWPKTGRPYNGIWVVFHLQNRMVMFYGTMANCINYISISKYHDIYDIRKQCNTWNFYE